MEIEMVGLKYTTAGESHGEALVGILSGMLAGVPISEAHIDPYLKRRQKASGRGARSQRLEQDRARILSGVWRGKTTGAPIAILIENRARDAPTSAWTVPRPGHADYAGFLKYGLGDITPIAERASGRETALRTALGAIALKFLDVFNIGVAGFTLGGGYAVAPDRSVPANLLSLLSARDASPFYCPDRKTTAALKIELRIAAKKGTTLGGVFEVRAYNIAPGLGSFAESYRRLDARLAGALMSIPSVKAVEIGDGIRCSKMLGYEAVDAMFPPDEPDLMPRVHRKTNHAGGIEGGMTNGEIVVARAYLKPVPTQQKPLPSVDLETGEAALAPYVRSDIFVVPAASVVGEAAVGMVLADAFLEKFGGDHIRDVQMAYAAYIRRLSRR
ncbi:MAG: chorismate synthase [bacterium]